MTDLERQIRAYADVLDSAAPPVDELALRAVAAVPARRRRSPAILAGLAAAALVAVVVGSVAVLGSLRSPEDATATSTTTPTSTSVPRPDEDVTPSLGPSRYLALVSSDPAYAGGEDGDASGRPRVAAGPVVIADGVYHVVFAAGGEDDMWEAVFHGTSPDGSQWSIDPDPVVFPDVVGASDLLIGSLDRLEDGTWVMYYHVAFDTGGHGNHVLEYSFGRATAASPAGPWTADEGPVLLPGDGAAWDAGVIRYPTVIRQGSSWLMFYVGSGSKGDEVEAPSAMGLATSRDGISWEKLAEPVFTGDPQLAWEDGSVSRIDVEWTGDRYVLLYAGRTGGSRGLATSPDGIDWQRVTTQPVLTGLDVPRPAIFSTSMLVDDGRLRVYVSNGGHRTTSSVYEMELLPLDAG